MAVRILGGEPCRVARREYFFPVVGDQHGLPGEHIDELVAAGVPMTLARPRAGRQATQIDPELGQSGGIAELGAFPGTARHIERRWVERGDHGGKFSHRLFPCQLLSKGKAKGCSLLAGKYRVRASETRPNIAENYV